ncbi:MAG: rRNA maturation RNase YbeY [Xanthobacteraceae bacterium]|jgi:probable rRNA maturation factor
MTRPAPSAIEIDVIVASARWKEPKKVEHTVRQAISRAAAAALSTRGAELAIVLTDDSAIRLLNRDWRDIDAATNVLSFPSADTRRRHLGDIVLAFETITREARAEKKPFAHHLAHLAVHGFLHLIGYDHERASDAEAMERTEREILRQLAIPDPYRPRAGMAKSQARSRPTGRAKARKPVRLPAGRLRKRPSGRPSTT